MSKDELLSNLMRYYRPSVLAMFHNQSDKYVIQTEEFEGTVRIRDSYRDPQDGTENESWLNVSFGFRASRDGEWAVAAWGPDLAKASNNERKLWSGFQMDERALAVAHDPRFQKWVSRYIEGSWHVEPGPIAALDEVVRQLNALCLCVVNMPLITSSEIRGLCFPLAENNHRYHDAHAEVYKLIIDGLNKEAIKGLGAKLGIAVNPDDKTTVRALETLLLSDTVRSAVRRPLDQVSKQRRLAGHKERPPAERFPAFEEFGKDVRALVTALEILRNDLAARLNVDVARCEERASALKDLPAFDESRPVRPNYAISRAFQIEGKQVVRVRAGYTVPRGGRHDSEALILEF